MPTINYIIFKLWSYIIDISYRNYKDFIVYHQLGQTHWISSPLCVRDAPTTQWGILECILWYKALPCCYVTTGQSWTLIWLVFLRIKIIFIVYLSLESDYKTNYNYRSIFILLNSLRTLRGGKLDELLLWFKLLIKWFNFFLVIFSPTL